MIKIDCPTCSYTDDSGVIHLTGENPKKRTKVGIHNPDGKDEYYTYEMGEKCWRCYGIGYILER